MIIKIKNLSLAVQGNHLVTIGDWSLHGGKVYGLSGDTGSGKSTIGKWLAHLDPVYWEVVGEPEFDEMEVDQNMVGVDAGPLYLLQDAYQIFNPYLPILTHFEDIWSHQSKISPVKSFDDIYDILTTLGISNPRSLIRRKVHQISQGEAQRMAFTLGLLRPASIRIYDEVFSNVDIHSSIKMVDFLRKFCIRSHSPAIIISHQTDLLNQFMDGSFLIRDGKLEEVILEEPQETLVKQVVECFPLIEFREVVVPAYRTTRREKFNLCYLPAFAIGRGECVGIFGSSGTGKTTFLKGLLGEHGLSWTECKIGGNEDAIKSNLNEIDIRYLPQSVISCFNPAYPIRTSIQEIQTIHHIQEGEILQFLTDFGLEAIHLDQYPYELSGGEIQRLGIISVLLGNPDIILLDESFSSVDKDTRESIWSKLLKRQKFRQFSILVVSHDVDWLREKMNRVYELKSAV